MNYQLEVVFSGTIKPAGLQWLLNFLGSLSTLKLSVLPSLNVSARIHRKGQDLASFPSQDKSAIALPSSCTGLAWSSGHP